MKTILVSGFALMLSWLGQAQAADEFQTNQSLKLVDEIILPAYQGLLDATDLLVTSATAFCAAPDTPGLDNVQQQFQSTVDAWQSVQWLRKGPAIFAFRHRRMALWPDKHDTGARQIRNLLREQDPAILDPDRFATGSVAIQGIPALERLLFNDQVLDDFTTVDNSYRCQYLVEITSNLHRIATALRDDWANVYRDAIATPDGGNSFFELADEVSGEFLSQLVTQLQFVLEQKLERPLGIDLSAGRQQDAKVSLDPNPRRAENWRSHRALRNIKINLGNMISIYNIALKPLIQSSETADQIGSAFTNVEQQFAALPDNLDSALATEPAALLAATESLDQLFQVAEKTLPAALDISLGFNGLDGD